MKLRPQNYPEFFITRMRWLVIFGSPILFFLTGLNMGWVFWLIVGITAFFNGFVHIYLLYGTIKIKYSHLLSLLDIVFVSTLLFLRGKHQTDLHQLYYFLILVLGIRYGVKRYFGLVLVIGVVYSIVSYFGALYYATTIDPVQLATQLIYFFAFGILTSYILQREYSQRLEKEELLTELQAAYRQLCIYNAHVEEMAIKDPLTGLFNYRYFSQRLKSELEWSRKYHKPLSVILLDIDHFKSFNDTYGHLAGDEALKKAAEVFTQNVRENDIVARYGGEEFLILLPDTEMDEAYLCAERIRNSMETTGIFLDSKEKEKALNITVSAGVTSLSMFTDTESELIAKADKALYQAKNLGRNMVKTMK